MNNLLEIKNLKVNFNVEGQVVHAVREVYLDVREGEVLVLAGESGSGKSVTALSITRLLPKTAEIVSGVINFHWVDLVKLNEEALSEIRGKEIAYIFQEPTSYLNPVYTIGNQLMEAIMLHHDKTKVQAQKEEVELLDLVKIKDPGRVIYDYPHQLSGGMNQRVLLAMALACKPKLLIADEPTTSLDVTVEAQILQLLLELKKQLGFSLLFITHNLSIARRIADRVSVMYRGKVVEEGNVEKIFSNPEHEHTKELIKAYEKIGKI